MKIQKNHDISKILWNQKLLTNFPEKGGSENLIFRRKNNDLGAGPPKDLLLAKCTGKLRNLLFLLILGGNSPKNEKVILGDFWFPGGSHSSGTYEFAQYFNGLGSFWASGRAEGCVFHFLCKMLKIYKNMKFLKFDEISRSFMKIMNFMRILDFCESGGSKTLIFPRKY